jgi:hypothetical protein
MADYLYMVDLSGDEETASNPEYVDRLLVQLKCDDHKKSRLPEADREASACELAVSRYDPENTLFGYRRAKRYDGTLPLLATHLSSLAGALFGDCDFLRCSLVQLPKPLTIRSEELARAFPSRGAAHFASLLRARFERLEAGAKVFVRIVERRGRTGRAMTRR